MNAVLKGLEVNLLLALDALLVDRNVTHAAERLHITQSAMSGRLAKLRHILADPLLVPASNGRGMVPTEHALALQGELRFLLERLAAFGQKATVFDPALSTRRFRIAAFENPSAILAPEIVQLVQSRAPGVELAFLQPDVGSIVPALQEGSLDLYLGSSFGAPPDLISRSLFEDELVTAQRRGHPRGRGELTLDEFCDHDHLLVSSTGDQFFGVIDHELEGLGRRRRVGVSVQNYALAPLILISSDYLCTLPKRLLTRFSHSLDLFTPPLELGRFGVTSYWHPRSASDPGHQWLRTLVFEAAQAER